MRPDVLHRPEHIAPVGHDHEPGIGRDEPPRRFGGDGPALEREDGQPDTMLPFVLVERPQHGVVVEGGGEDMAAGLFSREKSLDEEVQGIGRVLGEDHVFGRVCAQEAGERLAGERDIVLPLGAGGPARPEERQGEGLPDGLQHLRGFRPARCGVVQVDDRSGGSHAARFSDDPTVTAKKGSVRVSGAFPMGRSGTRLSRADGTAEGPGDGCRCIRRIRTRRLSGNPECGDAPRMTMRDPILSPAFPGRPRHNSPR